MTTRTPQAQVEEQMRGLLEAAGLPEPDDVAHMQKAVIFLWYATKAFVLVDLDEVPPGMSPLDGLDADHLRRDILGEPIGPPFAEAA